MVSEKIIDKALGGKKAIACDSCIHKRARWYCAADDAFLCQACDASVHSANPLARRHERVRLKTSSLRLENSVPSWHKGFTKKARTSRHATQQKLLNFDEKTNKNSISSAPEVCLDENSREEHELIFRVPSCDPLLLSGNSKDLMDAADHPSKCKSKDSDLSVKDSHHEVKSMHDIILPSELDMVEFAADVESLLGKSHDDDCYEMEQYFNNAKNLSSLECCSSGSREVKLEGYRADKNSDNLIARKQLDIGFDHESAANCGNHEEIKAKKEDVVQGGEVIDEDFKEKGISLSLDYEAIIASWSIHETPWFTGDGPRLDLKESWTDHYMGTGGLEVTHLYGGLPGMGKHVWSWRERGKSVQVQRKKENKIVLKKNKV